MSYHLDFSKQAKNDIAYHKKSGNKAVVKKLLVLLNELSEHPTTGTGKPEQLKYQFAGIINYINSLRSNNLYEGDTQNPQYAQFLEDYITKFDFDKDNYYQGSRLISEIIVEREDPGH